MSSLHKDDSLSLLHVFQCSGWSGREGEINIYHVSLGVLFSFTLLSHRGVSSAVSLNTACEPNLECSHSCALRGAAWRRSDLSLLSQPVAPEINAARQNHAFVARGTNCGLVYFYLCMLIDLTIYSASIIKSNES